MKNLIAIFLIIASIIIFFSFIRPMYGEIGGLREDVSSYNDTLQKADTIERKISEHESVINGISPENMAKLEKLLPDTVDNVRLIIDMSTIASDFGLVIRDIDVAQPEEERQGEIPAFSTGTYDSIDLSLSVTSSYGTFLEFLRALERSLRLVDVTAISFEPGETANSYDFNVTLKTYWLK